MEVVLVNLNKIVKNGEGCVNRIIKIIENSQVSVPKIFNIVKAGSLISHRQTTPNS